MGWFGVAFRVSVLVGIFAAFITLPAFQEQRDAVLRLLSTCPMHWFSGELDHQHGSGDGDLKNVLKAGEGLLLTREQLSAYDGKAADDSPLYVAILGSVFDVTAGRKHYGPGGSYSFFSGRDATRAFVTGDFKESGLTDDVSDLTSAQWLDVLYWFNFYHKSYRYIGRVIGRFYDENGSATPALLSAQDSIDTALMEKQRDDAQRRIFPPCNSHWSEASGKTVWCSDKSGGIERDWEGVPRKFFDASSQHTRCVCVRTTGAPSDQSLPNTGNGDLGHPSLREYEDCPPHSNTCSIND